MNFLHALYLACLALLAAVHGHTTCPPDWVPPASVVFSAVLPLSDPILNSSSLTRYSAVLVQGALNAALPLINRRHQEVGLPEMVLKIMDSGSTPGALNAAADEALSNGGDRTVGLFGALLAKSDRILEPKATQAGIPLYDMMITGEDLSDPVEHVSFFRLTLSANRQARAIGNFLSGVLGVREVILVVEDFSFDLGEEFLGLAPAWKSGLAAAGVASVQTVEVPGFLSSNLGDFEKAISQIGRSKYRYVVMGVFPPTYTRMAYVGRKMGVFGVPRPDPFVAIAPLRGLYNRVIQAFADLAAAGRDPSENSPDDLSLPFPVPLIQLGAAFAGAIVVDVVSSGTGSLGAAMADEFRAQQGIEPVNPAFTAQSLRAADALFHVSYALELAKNQSKLCFVLGSSEDEADHKRDLYSLLHQVSDLGLEGPGGPLVFDQDQRRLSPVKFSSSWLDPTDLAAPLKVMNRIIWRPQGDGNGNVNASGTFTVAHPDGMGGTVEDPLPLDLVSVDDVAELFDWNWGPGGPRNGTALPPPYQAGYQPPLSAVLGPALGAPLGLMLAVGALMCWALVHAGSRARAQVKQLEVPSGGFGPGPFGPAVVVKGGCSLIPYEWVGFRDGVGAAGALRDRTPGSDGPDLEAGGVGSLGRRWSAKPGPRPKDIIMLQELPLSPSALDADSLLLRDSLELDLGVTAPLAWRSVPWQAQLAAHLRVLDHPHVVPCLGLVRQRRVAGAARAAGKGKGNDSGSDASDAAPGKAEGLGSPAVAVTVPPGSHGTASPPAAAPGSKYVMDGSDEDSGASRQASGLQAGRAERPPAAAAMGSAGCAGMLRPSVPANLRRSSPVIHHFLAYEGFLTPIRRRAGLLRYMPLPLRLPLAADVASGLCYLRGALPYGPRRPLLRQGLRLGHIFTDSNGIVKIAPALEDEGTEAEARLADPFLVAPELRPGPPGAPPPGPASDATEAYSCAALSWIILHAYEDTQVPVVARLRPRQTAVAAPDVDPSQLAWKPDVEQAVGPRCLALLRQALSDDPAARPALLDLAQALREVAPPRAVVPGLLGAPSVSSGHPSSGVQSASSAQGDAQANPPRQRVSVSGTIAAPPRASLGLAGLDGRESAP